MADIKFELDLDNDEQITCRGCLSVNRRVKLLDHNINLYLMLLENETSFEDTEMKIWLCWECTALLDKVKLFQKRIRRAQYELGNLFNCSLSSLTQVKKHGYDVEYEETYYEEIKEEKPSKIEIPLIDVKEESSDSSRASDNELEKITDTPTSTVKKKKSKKQVKLHNKPTASLTQFDISQIDKYVTEVSHSVHDLELFMKKEKDLFKHTMHRTFLNRLKRFLNMKKSDFMRPETDISYPCSNCKSTYPSLESLKAHWEDHTINTFQCELCKKHYVYRSDLQVHFKTSHNMVYTCKVCGISCWGLHAFNKHKRELHGTFECDYCGKRFTTRRRITNHIRLEHKKPKIVCKLCKKTYQRMDGLTQHHNMHHVKSASELCYCVECNIQFENVTQYNTHLKISVKHRKLITIFHEENWCKLCNKMYSSIHALIRHNNTLHVRSASELCYCVECNIQFDNVAMYNNHLRRGAKHRKLIRVPCPSCDKVYHKRHVMMNHYRHVHLKKTDHYCQPCDRYFLNGYKLRCHKASVHDKIRPVKNKICPTCGRAFSTNTILENHIRTHTGERPFACSYCPSTFAQVTAMHTHVRNIHKVSK